MIRTTFDRLREVKDSLPHGSMDAIAQELGMTIRNVQKYYKLIREQEKIYVKADEII